VILADLPAEALDAFLRDTPLPKLTDRTVTDPATLRRALDQVRLAGWSLVDEELERGLRSIAVPIRNRAGRVTAALNLSCSASRTTVQQMVVEFLPVLSSAATRIARAVAR
jgi:IclR family transcriptional regulator, pca regulon regulatory protein